MSKTIDVIAVSGLAHRVRKSHWPARLDLVQSASGLFLGLFMWGHMAFVSTILISKDAMWWVTRMFEGQFIFGQEYPAIVGAIVALVAVMFVLHALLAMRKFPASFREYRDFRTQTNGKPGCSLPGGLPPPERRRMAKTHAGDVEV